MEIGEAIDTSKVEEEVAKIVGDRDEETASDSTTEETSEKKETSEEESTRPDSSLKTENDTTEEKVKEEEVKKDKDENDETRFDKIPRFQQLIQKEKEAAERAALYEESHRTLEEIRGKLGDLSADEISRYREVGKMLKKYPELAQKIEELVDGYEYGNAEVKNEINSLREEQEKLRQQMIMEKYDSAVDKLISDNKVEKEFVPLVKEIFENRVIAQQAGMKDLPKIFEKTLKDVDIFLRKKIASHIEDKNKEPKVPKSPAVRDKVIISDKEEVTTEDVVKGLTEDLKAASSKFERE